MQRIVTSPHATKNHRHRLGAILSMELVMVIPIFLLILSHTLHLYMWAFMLWWLGALPGHEEPIYFALVTYTTVGYGDVSPVTAGLRAGYPDEGAQRAR